MNAQGSRIFLYSAAAKAEVDSLYQQLSAIGYLNPIKVENHNQLPVSLAVEYSAIVLLLTDTACDQDALLDVMLQIKSVPVIGLFSETCSHCCEAVVRACHEVAIWPCGKWELDFRIGKLISGPHRSQNMEQNLFIKMNILGNSPEFLQVIDKACKIKQCDAPVYIDGETGTGKELIARAIHYMSARRDQPFIAANCGAIPDQLHENEFFGHEKGAYTDAREAGEGLIAQAEGGTLFLDEIETLSAKGQVVLLRFLENKMYRPLGSKATRIANLRVITATNESIAELVQRGEFRKDLYYRVNIMNLVLPPLRQRRGDINLLADHFIRQFQVKYNQPDRVLHSDSMAALKYYDWPGNVRELENLLHREFLLADGNSITISEIEALQRERRSAGGDRRMRGLMQQPMVEAKQAFISDFEQLYLSSALDRAKGNVSEAARLAGKERRSFTRLLEKHSLNSAHYKIY